MTDHVNNDLTLEPPSPKKARRQKAPTPPEDLSPTVRLELAFKADFEERYRCPIGNVLYKPARDRTILKRLIADVGEAEARALVRDFFFRFDQDRHVKFRTVAGNVVDFQKCLDRLIMLRNGAMRDTTNRDTDNDREIDRARGKR